MSYHVHDDQTWEWGAVCEACRAPRSQGGGKVVNFNIARLKQDNVNHRTQLGIEKEIVDAARAEGREIGRA